MYRIRKKFRFESAHFLDGAYSKECMNIHGHSYVMEVFLATPVLDSNKMVLDFKQLKEAVQGLIDDWDHGLLVSDELYNELMQSFGSFHIVKFGANPTAEMMAQKAYKYIQGKLPTGFFLDGGQLEKIRIHETETGYAEYSED